MSKGISIVSAIKRLFRDAKADARADGNLAEEGARCELSRNEEGLHANTTGNAVSGTSAPGKSPRLGLLSANSGPISSSKARETQECLQHSISDPCDELTLNKLARDSGGDWVASPVHLHRRQPPVGGRLGCMSTSELLFPTSSSPVALRPAARSDAAAPSLDKDMARPSLDIDGGAMIAAPSPPRCPSDAPTVDQLSSSAPAGLPGVNARTARSAARRSQNTEAATTEAMPKSASGMLLAMCPATPHTMRRTNWCLEDYAVSRRIYKGSASAVYKATCRHSGMPVALKVYFLSHVPANVVHMIVREIKIHADLVHDNIVMLYGAFQDKTRLVLVQEYAARGDLYRIHRAMSRNLSEEQLTSVVLRPFLDALNYLHGRGICHRDIKPENILFTQDHRLVVADFGVSINLGEERAVTRAGTLEYMAPEVERCPLKMLPEENKEKESLAYTTAVDIWATGVLAYELLVGFPPFVLDKPTAAAAAGSGGAGAAFLAEHANLTALSFPASLSPGARDFISRALAERPEERPTAVQLSRHPWLAAVAFSRPSVTTISLRQAAIYRNPSQLSNGGSPISAIPPRLGNAFITSASASTSPAV